MLSASATSIRARNAADSIMVPVGLAGLAITHALERLAPMLGEQRIGWIAQRVSAEVWISTGSQPSADRMCRYGG